MNPRYTADIFFKNNRELIKDVRAEKVGHSWMIGGDFAVATIQAGGQIFIKDHETKKIYLLKGNRMIFQDYFQEEK